MDSFTSLQRKIKYKFNDIEILRKALTHSSFANKNDCGSNERLEFLGDSVLGFVLTEYLFNEFNALGEGTLSRIKGNLCGGILVNKKAGKLKLRKYLLIVESKEKIKSKKEENFLGDALEALIGAVYVDSDFDTVRKVIIGLFKDDLKGISFEDIKDSKSVLQELIQKKHRIIPKYNLIKSDGDSHNKTFYVEVVIPEGRFKGRGKSKKDAESKAAKKAVDKIS
ncbi:MAG: ribonuclease III [Candidatus Altiarchaeales archaeon A3]|nr:MAG: ribonuclease III [Candidatus Altiarchaeales archaeon A3]